jgi:5-methylcytosine-specific restriction enzyme subunit McrC
VKYKFDSGPGHDSDLYQLLAYATATGLHNATLIYADGPLTPQAHVVRGTGTRLHIRHLDLKEHPLTVLAQLRTIAKDLLPAEV